MRGRSGNADANATKFHANNDDDDNDDDDDDDAEYGCKKCWFS